MAGHGLAGPQTNPHAAADARLGSGGMRRRRRRRDEGQYRCRRELARRSRRPNREKVAQVTRAQVEEIARAKMPDLNAASLEAAVNTVAGTARSMGITIIEG